MTETRSVILERDLQPVPPVASKDKDMRYFHIHETDTLDGAPLAGRIRQAAALPGWIP